MPGAVLGAGYMKVSKKADVPVLSGQEFPIFQWEKNSKLLMIDIGERYTKMRQGKKD